MSGAAERMADLGTSIFASVEDGDRDVAFQALRDWGADLILLHERTHGHALLVYGLEVFRHHGLLEACRISERTLCAFLIAMEDGCIQRRLNPE